MPQHTGKTDYPFIAGAWELLGSVQKCPARTADEREQTIELINETNLSPNSIRDMVKTYDRTVADLLDADAIDAVVMNRVVMLTEDDARTAWLQAIDEAPTRTARLIGRIVALDLGWIDFDHATEPRVAIPA